MSNSTKNMLTKMKPSLKLSSAARSKTENKSAKPSSSPKFDNRNVGTRDSVSPLPPLPNVSKPQLTPNNLDKMQNLMEMCLSPKNSKPKLTSKS
jgi:hypothetical protein